MITHGAPGCAWIARWMRSDHAISHYTPIHASSIFEHDVIFGGADKLRKMARWALENWKINQLFIINTCTGSLINDPTDEIAKELEEAYGKPVIYLDTPGFKGLASAGVDEAFGAMLEKFSDTSMQKEKNRVNLIAPFLMGSGNWLYDLEEIKRLLEALGLSINCVLTHDTTTEDLAHFLRAEADIYLTYETLPQLEQYEDTWGLRRIGQELPLPVGLANTEEWYRGIAEFFGKRQKADEILREEANQLKPLRFSYNSTWVQTWLGSKKAAVLGPASWAASFARSLYHDLAIFPVVICLYGDTAAAVERAKEILKPIAESPMKPFILENPTYIQAIMAVDKKQPDFAIGQTQEKPLLESHGIPHLSLAGLFSVLGTYNFIPFPSMGYRGIMYNLTMLARLMEETFHEQTRWKDLRYRGREENL